MTDQLSLVAVTPGEIATNQQQLIEWCKKKKHEVIEELHDLRENVAIAKKNKWRVSALERSLKLCERRWAFYGKIHTALDQGYLIIPNLEMELLAIRVSRLNPRRKENTSYVDRKLQKPDLLSEGEGRYVADSPKIYERTNTTSNQKGEIVKQTVYWAEEFQDVAFPVVGVKPILLDAAARAMALKVFDAIGLVPPSSRYDPILLGRIYNPKGFGSWMQDRKAVSFFLGWWFDTRALE